MSSPELKITGNKKPSNRFAQILDPEISQCFLQTGLYQLHLSVLLNLSAADHQVLHGVMAAALKAITDAQLGQKIKRWHKLKRTNVTSNFHPFKFTSSFSEVSNDLWCHKREICLLFFFLCFCFSPLYDCKRNKPLSNCCQCPDLQELNITD